MKHDPYAENLMELAAQQKTRRFWVEEGLFLSISQRVYIQNFGTIKWRIITENHDTVGWASREVKDMGVYRGYLFLETHAR